MENQDIYNNNYRLRSHQQQQQQYQQGSRADKASSWRSCQRDPFPSISSKRRRSVNEKNPTDSGRLNTVYKSACQRDDRVSSSRNNFQRHHPTSQTSFGFTVFNDNQLNEGSPVQPGVGAHLNPRNPPGLLMSPLLQSMHMSSPFNTMQLSSPPHSAVYSTSADLKSPRSIVNADSQIGLNVFHRRATESIHPSPSFSPWSNKSNAGSQIGFNELAPESIHPSQSFSLWSNNPNALQLCDSNQQSRFNSSLMLQKHNELDIKASDTCKPTPHPPTSTNNRPPTWSQIAAKDPQQLDRRASCATTVNANTAESRVSTVPIERTVPAIPLVKEDMDFYMAEASAPTASLLQTADVASPIRESRYITDSLAFISSGVSNDQNISVIRPFTILKLTNISWNASASDIRAALSRYKALRLPDIIELPQCIHVFMDVKTGKTLNTAYVELKLDASSSTDMDAAIRSIKIPQAQGRHITVTRSSYDELCNELFSGWKGEFTNGLACPHTDSRDSLATQQSQYYIGQRDLQSLLNVCRFFKSYYNRKCAERPFEFLITIIMNMPWKQPHAVKIAQRDIVYECYKLATEALCKHVHREYHSFDDDLLPRMVRAAIICDGFTVRQKKAVLGNAKMECPPDLESYMQEPILNTSGFADLLR
ncbi:hypothetical protein MAM1_0267c08956 [Mucor ambiguus]|uniref:Uncharacterized protein n=1 Tax=Mucor ambiguus TaxID=91626 RepID=A0A0C9MPP4_9FUNG|nr:hypothetical protein MAM1_0267c08956 [Mucor ambiguus]